MFSALPKLVCNVAVQSLQLQRCRISSVAFRILSSPTPCANSRPSLASSSSVALNRCRRYCTSTTTTTEGDPQTGQGITTEGESDSHVGRDGVTKGQGERPAERGRVKNRGYLKDRTKVIPLEVSMRYLKSSAYKETYGDNLIWVLYRRNFKGQFAPKKTRRTCIRGGQITTGNACPICRDEFLVLHPENVDLLKQFISPFNGEILSYAKTGICRVQHERLVVAVKQAKDLGTITFDVPFREYDYSEYQKLYDSYNLKS